MNRVMAIDPGSKKCGLLLADLNLGIVLDGKVVEKSGVIELIVLWKNKMPFQQILLGNGTSSEYWGTLVKGLAPLEVIEERGTTLRARDRYWELWPPSKLFSWVPRGLLVPAQSLDAVAALVMLEDYFGKKLFWPGQPNFTIAP